MKRNCALFQGRFQPPTIAHLCTVETILAEWQSAVIGVVYDSPRPDWFDSKWDEYLRESAGTSYAPGKNPFTPAEVKQMWDACIGVRGLDQHVRCDIIKRPYFDREFNFKYPPDEITIVRPIQQKGDADMDHLRGRIFPELLNREVRYVSPLFKLHNTEIREMVHFGKNGWEDFVPQGAYEVFLRIDGPARVLAASRITTQ